MARALRRLHPSFWAPFVFGPASRGDYSVPVSHKHDEFERASEVDLAGFEVETDAQGHHYAVRKEDLPKEAV
ncbi:hypothetical protein [Arthrobacter sp. SO5]|uniref:hypothetical protein n=1 Tax=Arthrobacter sp. SO5 TaxID=1897055 RepID=UPI001E499440|nr:hypothetical protein [Arthrobacter sp. SO5]